MKILKVDKKNISWIEPQLVELEKSITYPYGDDFFFLDHGNDYFQFFKRLGKVNAYVAVIDKKVIAIGLGVLRQFDQKKCWYLGDLKVAKNSRGRHIPLKLLKSAFWLNYLRCQRGYAISMNPEKGVNRVVLMLNRFKLAPIKLIVELKIFSFDESQFLKAKPIIEKWRGEIGLLNLEGIKDLTMIKSKEKLKLYHIVHGDTLYQQNVNGLPQGTYMICSPINDSLTNELTKEGFIAQASASVVGHRMNHFDWKKIVTSEI